LQNDSRAPAEQVVAAMDRIYGGGLTTTSGGNVSMRDREGSTWITPGSLDKGTLRADQVVRVSADGVPDGPLRPSLELVFHRAIYEARPDAGAVIHAHPPALVAFSIAHRIPDTRILPKTRAICGPIGYAAYALPGSEPLAENIALVLAEGHDIAVMENHAVVCLGTTLREACRRLESLELCARVIIKAAALGEVHALTEAQLALGDAQEPPLPELSAAGKSGEQVRVEDEARAEICRFIARGCRQRLFSSNEGTISRRLGERSFLVTPFGYDRYEVLPEDLVLIRDGCREAGKAPSRAVGLHREVYDAHPEIRAVILAQPANLMAFAVTCTKLDTRLMPESFVFLRDVPLVPFGPQYREPAALAAGLSRRRPLALIENECVLVTGGDLLQAFDRLEVAEFSAKSVLQARAIGGVINITEEARREIHDAYIKD